VTDQHGIAAPKINYTLSDNTRKMLTHGLDRGKEVMRAAGARKVTGFGPVRHTGWHLMGTARMGRDPKTSVLNQYNQAHDVPNLFITDGAAMASSGTQNPSLTYMALSARAAHHAVEFLKAGKI
jgi:choline dehydrogenase-like flavoprotein